jgi:cytochrome c-type biogenesis protein CcmH
MKNTVILVGLIGIFGFLWPATIFAQGEDPDFPTDNDVNLIAKQLYCPVCPNTPLDVCETTACQDWRAQIRDQLRAGWTETQILDYFVEQYGERVLAEPQRQGFSSLVWILPLIITIISLVAIWYVVKIWKTNRGADSQSSFQSSELEPDIVARIEEKLDRLR